MFLYLWEISAEKLKMRVTDRNSGIIKIKGNLYFSFKKEYKLRRLYPEYPNEDKLDELDEKFINNEIGERQYTLELRRLLAENRVWFLNASNQIDKIFKPYIENQRKRQKTKETLLGRFLAFFSHNFKQK